VQMATQNESIDWTGCPNPHLIFCLNEKYTVAQLSKMPNDRWYFRTLSRLPDDHVPSQHSSTSPARVAGRAVSNSSSSNTFESFWAPLSATVEGQLPSPSITHLSGNVHKSHEEAVAAGCKLPVSRAAIKLAKKLGEEPSLTLSRFQVGLGLVGRFCEPCHVEAAEKLERVRDVGIPVKFLREVLPVRESFLWITTSEFWEAQERYEQRRKKSSRKEHLAFEGGGRVL